MDGKGKGNDGRQRQWQGWMARAMARMDGKGNGNSGNSKQGIKQVARAQHTDERQWHPHHMAQYHWHGLQLWQHSKWVNGYRQSTAGSSSSVKWCW